MKIDVFKEPSTDDEKVTKAFYGKGPLAESVKIVKFLEQMEVLTSATLESQHHSNKIRRTLTAAGRSKNQIYDNIRDKDFTTGLGIDGQYHVWRDR
jgi:hypothetical protein